MAPSRKKGASKAAAAAAAAACRQWKVGDLVLAKLKGFPAWPATVSEPEKWGYSADWKKVLVYFFGTQQIAFCNPADVEAFTEEKKQSLLTKRHGKGSDFVRAVHEIIDSYENLKKQDKGINAQSSNEVTLTNTTKSMESLADSGLNDEAPASTVEPCPKSSDSTRADKDPGFFPIKGDGAATQNDALHDKRTISENPTGNFVVTEAPLPNTYSRKKVGGIQAQKFVTQKRAPSARRSRSSSRVESRRFQNFISPSNNIAKSPGNVAVSLLRDGSIRRAKRIRKSPDVSEVHDTHSPALVSNSCLEENGSEIVTVDSDTHSLNDGSTVESGYNMMQPESAECCEGDVELSQRLDFQAKSVVVKKKRKPSRKRASNGATELTGRVNKDAGVETELHKSGEVKPSDLEKSNGRYSKEDGDEHLPLVKRARVRMSRPSSTGEEVDALIKAEVKSSGVSNSCLGHVSTALDCEEDSPVDRKSVVVKGHAYDSSPSNKSPVNKPPLWEVKKQQHASSVDVEAALPPSKRLHRALEAMSANAAEHGQTSSEVPSTMKMFTNGCSSSFTRDCSNISAENTARSEFGVQNKDAFNNDVTQECTSGFSSNLNPPIVEESAKSFVNLAACHKPVEVDNSSEHVFCEDVPVETVNSADATSLDTHMAETVVLAQSPKPLSPQLGSQQALSECSQSLLRLTLPSTDSKIENCELRPPCKEDDPSEIPRMSLEPVSGSMEIATRSPQNNTGLHLYVAQSNSETTKLSSLPPAENNQDNGVFDVVKETKTTLKDSNATPSPTTEEVVRAAVHGAHLSNSSPLSEDHLSHHKAVPGIRSSSSPTEGLDSTACASPPNTSICIMSTSDNCNLLENNGCCSPDVRLHHEKPKHATKSSNRGEANAALTSFEANLGTLTRTKESIGRATRSAIECAKFGIAPKVVEVIARNLESEPSLHRRVDLFFLVDSITQCSRGLKGDAGGIYPSAIQAKLPRLLLAAAPPGSSALENRRQCLKVLRLWQERRILPESVIRRHIRDLDSLSNSSSAGAFSRRPLRTERAFDDPLREMEGMVDEYGSNSSFQLPGFRMPPMVKDGDDGSDSDGGNFEAVTPEHNSENTEERGWARTPAAATEKRSHILEDVDGELEMEDVAPSCEAEMSSTSNVAAVNTLETSHQQQHFPPPFAPPLPKDVPPSSPPLPTSPPPPRPPPPPPPPSLPPPSALPDPITNNLDSRLYVGIRNIKEDLQQCTLQQSVAPSINPTVPDAFHYHAPPENRDPQGLMQMSESVNSCSISNLHVVSHQPVRPVNSVQQLDGAALHHKAFHLPPPHPAPSNQFSYVQADQPVQSRREIPPQSYPHQFHYVPNTDTGNFYSDHDRMKLAPHDISENWRFSAPLSGPCYPESSGLPYAHAAYAGPPCEPAPAIPSHNWAFPPPPMNHREPIPHRPPSEGPIPVAVRAPNFWRPR